MTLQQVERLCGRTTAAFSGSLGLSKAFPLRRWMSVVRWVAILLFSSLTTAGWVQRGTTERVSVCSSMLQGNKESWGASISADGRFVAFRSRATNLVPGDTNAKDDTFVRDRLLGTTERVSVSSSGEQGNDHVYTCAISADGRFVAFQSRATNLVPGDTNAKDDIFVRDRLLGTTERVSVSSSGEQGNDTSYRPSVAAEGRFVAFASLASNLVPGDSNGREDIFVRDRLLGTTERVSVSSSGEEGNHSSPISTISADGRFVAFSSRASNLVPEDTNGFEDIFVRDRWLGTTERVNLSSRGEQGNSSGSYPSIDAAGRFVAFSSPASNLVPGDTNAKNDIFVRDRLTGTTERVSVSSSGEQANSPSLYPSVDAAGRFVTFQSTASNLVPGDTNAKEDIFVRVRLLVTTERVSVSSSGVQGNENSWNASIAADGRFVAFDGWASNLVEGDTNGASDVFVHQYGYDTSWPAVEGKLVFQSWIAGPPVSTLFEFRAPGQTQAYATWEAALTSDSSFTLPAPVGIFDLSVKHSHWLRRTLHGVDTTSGAAQVGSLALINGDVDGDNLVGLRDLNGVLLMFTRTDPLADLDGSGMVGLHDLNIVLLNFAKVGDP